MYLLSDPGGTSVCSASVTLFMTTVLGLCDQGNIGYKDRRDTAPGDEGAFGESMQENLGIKHSSKQLKRPSIPSS